MKAGEAAKLATSRTSYRGDNAMKPVNEVINNIKPDQAEPTTSCSPSLTEAEQTERAEAWAVAWRVLYGMKLISFDAVNDEGKETKDYTIWRRAVSDLTPEEIRRGVNKAKDYKGTWFPVNIFRDLCKPTDKDLGLPGDKEAYYEACLAGTPKAKQRYTHPIVFLAGQATGWWNLKTKREAESFKQFKHFYDLFAARVRNGEKLHIREVIEHKQEDAFSEPVDMAKEQERFNDLKKMLGCKNV